MKKPFLKFLVMLIALAGLQRTFAQTNTFTTFKNSQIEKLKQAVPSTATKAPLSLGTNATNTPKDKIYISSIALPPQKTANYRSVPVSADCNLIPVNYKINKPGFDLFKTPTNLVQKIFPGAVYKFDEVKNQSFGIYNDHTGRNPMDMETTIFNPTPLAAISNTVEVFDHATVNGIWTNILRNNIAPGVKTPGNISCEIILAESESQLRSDLNMANTVDVSTTLNFPIPDIPVSIDASNNVSISNSSSVSSSTENKKNTIIIKYRQILYSAVVNYQDNKRDIFANVSNSSLPSDLLYISAVDYGQVYYIIVTSSYSKSALQKAVMNKVGTRTDVTPTIEGMPVTASVGVTTDNLTTQEINQILTSSSTTVRVLQWGGEPLSGITESTLEGVMNQLKNVNTKFSSDQIGLAAPVGYQLNFCRDHSLANINYDLYYGTANCGLSAIPQYKYDAKVKFSKLRVIKCIEGPGDDKEDLFGNVKICNYGIGTGAATDITDVCLWCASKANALHIGQTSTDDQGTIMNPGEYSIPATNLDFNQLSTLNFALSVELYDDDLLTPKYVCSDNCPQKGKYYYLKLADNPAVLDKIKSMVPNTNNIPQAVEFYGDLYFDVNVYENDDKNSSHVRLLFQLLLTIKS